MTKTFRPVLSPPLPPLPPDDDEDDEDEDEDEDEDDELPDEHAASMPTASKSTAGASSARHYRYVPGSALSG